MRSLVLQGLPTLPAARSGLFRLPGPPRCPLLRHAAGAARPAQYSVRSSPGRCAVHRLGSSANAMEEACSGRWECEGALLLERFHRYGLHTGLRAAGC